MKMRDIISLVETMAKEPLTLNMVDAIDHADHEGHGWGLDDFSRQYLGFMTVDEIRQYDDVDSWLDLDSGDDVTQFRDGAWAEQPGEDALPPIILITAPDEGTCHTQIGDGRGRVNYANARGLRLHVWHLVHSECAEGSDATSEDGEGI